MDGLLLTAMLLLAFDIVAGSAGSDSAHFSGSAAGIVIELPFVKRE